jgi:hypothetical protein
VIEDRRRIYKEWKEGEKEKGDRKDMGKDAVNESSKRTHGEKF